MKKKMRILSYLALILVGCGKQNANVGKTLRLFHMVSPNLVADQGFPSNVKINNDEDFYNVIKSIEGKAFFLGTVTLGGKEGYILTTAIVYTGKDNMKGWNIVINRDGVGKTERKYFSITNGIKADMILSNVLYLVATEVPLETTKETLTNDELDRLLEPSLGYLRSLL